jgi:hypothetical protein
MKCKKLRDFDTQVLLGDPQMKWHACGLGRDHRHRHDRRSMGLLISATSMLLHPRAALAGVLLGAASSPGCRVVHGAPGWQSVVQRQTDATCAQLNAVRGTYRALKLSACGKPIGKWVHLLQRSDVDIRHIHSNLNSKTRACDVLYSSYKP